MNRSLATIIVLVGSYASCAVAESAAPNKPNIIFILADDQGYQDIGCQGAVGIKTPRLDRMAHEGVRLTSFYVGAWCSPTRAALLTGRNPNCAGIAKGPLRSVEPCGLPPDEVTLAELLKPQGYATALIGKWHLGLSKERSPVAQGFDYYSGVPLSQVDQGKSGHEEYYKRQWRIQDTNGRDEVEYNPCEEEFTQRCTKEAIAFIDRSKDRPFFLYLPHLMVHIEVVASPGFVGKSPRGVYGDACQELDWSTGQILDHLKKLGLDERTIVVYTSDNGGTPRRNSTVLQTTSSSNLPLRGNKFEMWEGGSRTPCIIRWPGKIPGGRVSDELVDVTDFLPTFAHLAGAKLPENRAIDGLNLWPFLNGTQTNSPRQMHAYFGDLEARKTHAIRVGPWKLIYTDKGSPPALYNLPADIAEKKNVAAEHPDIVKQLTAYAGQVNAALKADEPRPLPPVLPAQKETKP